VEVLRPVRRTLLRDTAYEAIRDAIVREDIPPGTSVRDVDLAERLGLSRAPVRDALARLADEGWWKPSRRAMPG
jgi:DNA-binding GntR family transcriptional regulator